MYEKIFYRERALADKDEPVKETDSEEPLSEEPETKTQDTETRENSQSNSCKKEKSEIDEFKDQLAAERDRVLRLSAEFENYKKRSSKELSEFKKFANETIFRQLLTVVDNMERAISSARENGNDGKALLDGIEMTYKDMLRILTSFNVKPVEAEGKSFDPAFHQAVTQQESDDHPENTVVAELQKGYLFHDRLIRPSMVVVSKAIIEKETEKK